MSDAKSEVVWEDCEFWFVWTKTGRIPRFTHHIEAMAIAEAERLARKRPGAKFIVLRAYRKVRVETPESLQAEADALGTFEQFAEPTP